MREAGPQQQLLAEVDAAARRVDAAIAGLTDEQASRPAADGWSVKDQLTHLTFWHEMRFFEVSRIARGGRASFPLTDETGVENLNEQIAANRRNLSLEQVAADLQFAREMLKQALLASPDDLAMSRFEEIGPVGSSHEMSHAELIEAWREKEGV
jgi:hypothetical protein